MDKAEGQERAVVGHARSAHDCAWLGQSSKSRHCQPQRTESSLLKKHKRKLQDKLRRDRAQSGQRPRSRDVHLSSPERFHGRPNEPDYTPPASNYSEQHIPSPNYRFLSAANLAVSAAKASSSDAFTVGAAAGGAGGAANPGLGRFV